MIVLICLFVYLASFLILRNVDRNELKSGNRFGLGSSGRIMFIVPVLNTLLLLVPLCNWISNGKVWAWITNKDLR